jgi:choline kinase
MIGPVDKALVLAAGNGDRFRNPTRESKLLQPVLGRPLIIRTIETARDAGITTFEIVLGYRADHVRTAIERQAPPDVAIRFTENPDWHLENGVSVLAARRYLQSRFALLMGDHLFEARVLRQLLRATRAPVSRSSPWTRGRRIPRLLTKPPRCAFAARASSRSERR